MPTTEAVLTEARTWIGTPFVHQGTLKGVGADCIGFVRGIWRELIGPEPEIPAYSQDWYIADDNVLTAMLGEHFTEVPVTEAAAGDVIVFSLRHGPSKHAAIYAGETMLHSRMNRSVREEPLTEVWRRMMRNAYRWP